MDTDRTQAEPDQSYEEQQREQSERGSDFPGGPTPETDTENEIGEDVGNGDE